MTMISKSWIACCTADLKESIPCDVYSVNGLPGCIIKGPPAFLPSCGRMLQRAVVNQTGIRIPSKTIFTAWPFMFCIIRFYIGLPVQVPRDMLTKRHDYTKILGEMAKELGLNIEINMLSLIAC